MTRRDELGGSTALRSLRIRPATAADAACIAAIHCESWRDAYAAILDPAFLAGPIEEDRRALWEARFAAPVPAQAVLLAETGAGDPAGFVCLYRDHDPRWGSLIDNLHVRPALRGHQIGEAMVRAAAEAIGKAGPLHLWVFAANEAAIRFYTRLGGTIAERALCDMPEALGAPELRMVWPDPAILRAQH